MKSFKRGINDCCRSFELWLLHVQKTVVVQDNLFWFSLQNNMQTKDFVLTVYQNETNETWKRLAKKVLAETYGEQL